MKKGFTLIELLAVIVIIALIAVIAIPTVLGVINKARKGAMDDDAKLILDTINRERNINPDFIPTDVTKGTIESMLHIKDDNYASIVVTMVDGKPKVVVTGQGKFDGLTAYGTKDNLKVVDYLI
jgi:type IV pilus assembly protein PilA